MKDHDYRVGMALIEALRELDTDGRFVTMCDAQELYERRRYMDRLDETGEVTWQARNPVAIELLTQDPDRYFSIIREHRQVQEGWTPWLPAAWRRNPVENK